MMYREGMAVLTAGGEKVGHVKYVVMTPRTQEITHLVIEKGFLLPEEKVMSLSWIARMNEHNDIILYKDKDDFETLPVFEEESYIPITGDTPLDAPAPGAYYYYGMPGALPLHNSPTILNAPPQYIVETRENIPEGTVALQIGADIISSDGQHVGHLDEIFTDDMGQNVTHFLISKGLFFPTRKSIPATWIDHVEEDWVHLSVSADLLKRLPDHDAVVT